MIEPTDLYIVVSYSVSTLCMNSYHLILEVMFSTLNLVLTVSGGITKCLKISIHNRNIWPKKCALRYFVQIMQPRLYSLLYSLIASVIQNS